jgi:hypothetical protein
VLASAGPAVVLGWLGCHRGDVDEHLPEVARPRLDRYRLLDSSDALNEAHLFEAVHYWPNGRVSEFQRRREIATGLLPGGGVVELLDGFAPQPTIKIVAAITPMLIAFFIKLDVAERARSAKAPVSDAPPATR